MNSRNEIRVLHLPEWYPCAEDAMLGLFVKNQIQGLPQAEVSSTVLYASAASGNTEPIRTEKQEGGIDEITLKLPRRKSAMAARLRYMQSMWREMKGLHAERPFDVVHVHVMGKAAWLAARFKRRYGVPFVLSEHWSRYLPEHASPPSAVHIRMYRELLKRAQAFTCVSDTLRRAMEGRGLSHPLCRLIPSTVDTARFAVSSEAPTQKPPRAVHISCMEDASKNISGLIKAVAHLSNQRALPEAFALELIGDGPDKGAMEALSRSLGLDDVLHFAGELEPVELARHLSDAAFLIQSSHYETFGTPVVESLACGVPVLSTPVGIFAEMQEAGIGLAMASSSVEHIAEGIGEMCRSYSNYDPNGLRELALGRFDKHQVGEQVLDLYKTCCLSQ